MFTVEMLINDELSATIRTKDLASLIIVAQAGIRLHKAVADTAAAAAYRLEVAELFGTESDGFDTESLAPPVS